MFVCLEVETEDAGVWAQIDKILCEKLGMSHILWGVNDTDKEVHPCKMPSNIYTTLEITTSCSNIRTRVQKAIEEVWSGEYDFIVLDVKTWATGSGPEIPKVSSIITKDSDEIINREE